LVVKNGSKTRDRALVPLFASANKATATPAGFAKRPRKAQRGAFFLRRTADGFRPPTDPA
jgi:hypothetical protein